MSNVSAKRLTRMTVVALLAGVLAALVLPGVALANPADPTPHWLEQADGTRFQAVLWGDEWMHGRETLEGYTILFDQASENWVYATRDVRGNLAKTNLIVAKDSPPDQVPKHLRPSKEAVQRIKARRERAPTEGLKGVPSTGTRNVPIVLIQYTDLSGTHSATTFQNHLFGGTATGPGDLDGYFTEVSYGAFTVSSGPGGITGWYTATNNHDYYGTNDASGNDQHPGVLVYEAVQKADSTFDFGPYDNDNDGWVDTVIVVFADTSEDQGCGNATDIWSHHWDLTSARFYDSAVPADYYTTGDTNSVGATVKVKSYILVPERLCTYSPPYPKYIRTVGVFAHELGHAIHPAGKSDGLPDLYDTDGSSNGIGYWGLMGSGSWNTTVRSGDSPAHMTPWSKWYEGWLTPTQVTAPLAATIPQVETNATAFQFLNNPGGVDWNWGSPGTGEYFLVENRQQTGFDQGLPGCGLLIWHIDENRPGDNTANADETHKLVDLEEADGLNHLDNKVNKGDAGDPHPGSTNNTTFDDISNPNSRLYDGSSSGVSIFNISACGSNMTANFGQPPDLSLTKADTPDPVIAGNNLTYDLVVTNNGPSGATGVTLNDTLPAGVTFVSATPSQGSCTQAGGTVTCDLGNLANGATATVTIVVTVDPSTRGTLCNTVSVSGNEPDPDTTNNTATECTTVNAETDLAVTKSDSADPVITGDNLTYTIEVTNNGPSTATGVTLNDVLPARVTFVSATPSQGSCSEAVGVVTCNLGTLAPGASAIVTITVTTNAPGVLTNTASVAGNETDPVPGNNTATEDTAVLADFGDAQDPPYPALFASGGAYHGDYTNEWLGVEVDGEPDARFPDNFNDGVILKPWYRPFRLARVRVTINTSGLGAARYGWEPGRRLYLRGWIDYNMDGDWDDPGELVADCDVAPGTIGQCNGWLAGWNVAQPSQTFIVRFNVGLVVEGWTWARFRLSYGAPVGPTGPADHGEVEDYEVGIFMRDP